MEKSKAVELAHRDGLGMRPIAVAVLGLMAAACAQSGAMSPASGQTLSSSGVIAEARPPEPSAMCAASEIVVFACELQESGDRIALCAGQGTAADVIYFTRTGSASGSQVFPADRRGAGQFMTTRVFSTGAIGIRTHSFEQSGQRHVLYSISGTGIEEQGLFTMPPGSAKAESEEHCVPGTQQDPGWKLAEGWKPDPIIEEHGLPHL